MRAPTLRSARMALPLATLVLFYWALFRFSAGAARAHSTPRPNLTAQESHGLLRRSKALFAEGKYQQALLPTLILHQAYPDNHIYIEQLAQTYDHLGNYEEEAKYWEKYLDYAPRPETGCPQIGEAYWKQGDEQKAISAFERCLALDPTNADSIFYLAHAREMAGQFNRAGQLYQRGIQVSPGYVDLRLGLARVWLQQDKVEAAKQTALAVLAKAPNNVDALLVLGLAYFREHHLLQAKRYLEKGARLSEGYADFHIVLGQIAERENDTPGAIREYTRALELRPTDGAVRARLGVLKGRIRR